MIDGTSKYGRGRYKSCMRSAGMSIWKKTIAQDVWACLALRVTFSK